RFVHLALICIRVDIRMARCRGWPFLRRAPPVRGGQGRSRLSEPPRSLKAGRRSAPESGVGGRDPAPGAAAQDVSLELLVELRPPLPPLGPHLPLGWHMVVA